MKARFVLGWFFCMAAGLFAATEGDARRVELRDLSARLRYQEGQIRLRDGLATINLPQGFRYIDPAGSETLLTGIWGNPSSGKKTLGTIVPSGFDPFGADAWCVIIQYEEDGYVKEDDAEKMNYPKLLKQMQEGTRQGSAERVKNGYPSIELVGWAAAPRYDKQTHKFYWAKELKFGDSKGENTLNYNLRILGRRGILVLNAVSGMSQFPRIEQATPEILGMIDFAPGQRYADYTPGDGQTGHLRFGRPGGGGHRCQSRFVQGIARRPDCVKEVCHHRGDCSSCAGQEDHFGQKIKYVGLTSRIVEQRSGVKAAFRLH